MQEKALKKYNAYLAVAGTPERITQLTEAKRSAEQYIENFDAELDAIQREKDARAQKHTSKNGLASYADSSCNSASPGGKDPKDRDKDRKEWRALTNKEARELAEKIGFREKKNAPFDSRNKATFYRDKDQVWITPDIDGHSGGVWKMFDKSGNTRLGTFNRDLTVRVGK